jgi:hypothetical protein
MKPSFFRIAPLVFLLCHPFALPAPRILNAPQLPPEFQALDMAELMTRLKKSTPDQLSGMISTHAKELVAMLKQMAPLLQDHVKKNALNEMTGVLFEKIRVKLENAIEVAQSPDGAELLRQQFKGMNTQTLENHKMLAGEVLEVIVGLELPIAPALNTYYGVLLSFINAELNSRIQ